MRFAISRQLYILYLFIITYGIVIVQCQIYVDDNNDLKILNALSDTLLLAQYTQAMADGSGYLSKMNRSLSRKFILYSS